MEEAQKKAAAQMLGLWREIVSIYKNNFSEARYLRAVWDLDERPTPYSIANEAGRDGDALDIRGDDDIMWDERAAVYILRFKLVSKNPNVPNSWGTLGAYLSEEEARAELKKWVQKKRESYALDDPESLKYHRTGAIYNGESSHGGAVVAYWEIDRAILG